MLELACDPVEMALEGFGRLRQRLPSAAGGPILPTLPKPLCPRRVLLTPQVSEGLLDRRRATRLRVTRSQTIELLPVLGWELPVWHHNKNEMRNELSRRL